MAKSSCSDELSWINSLVLFGCCITKINCLFESVVCHSLRNQFLSIENNKLSLVKKRHCLYLVNSTPFGIARHLFQVTFNRNTYGLHSNKRKKKRSKSRRNAIKKCLHKKNRIYLFEAISIVSHKIDTFLSYPNMIALGQIHLFAYCPEQASRMSRCMLSEVAFVL